MKIDPRVKAALEEAGVPYELELGGRHRKVRLAGRLAGILPRSGVSSGSQRAALNTIAQIRRVAREVRS